MSADSPVVRLAWHFLFVAERLIGARSARLTAVPALRALARAPHSYARTVRRVSPRLRAENSSLIKIPERWSRQHATVRVHRAGLALELDVRDNLHAILFCAGVYEPTFGRHLLAQLRPGDVVADIPPTSVCALSPRPAGALATEEARCWLSSQPPTRPPSATAVRGRGSTTTSCSPRPAALLSRAGATARSRRGSPQLRNRIRQQHV